MDTMEEADLFPLDGGGRPAGEVPLLNVIHAKYIEEENLSYQDLFQGFDELYAVTYSLGVRQIENVMRFFKYGEVIVGSPSQVRKDLAKLFAQQETSMDIITKSPYLQRMIRREKMQLFLTMGSHMKMYILHAEDGRSRVIYGSANFSERAWNEDQAENYIYMDEPEAYDQAMQAFEVLRDISSKKISVGAKPICEDGKNLDELPMISKIIEKQDAIVIREVTPPEEAEYWLTEEASAKKWAVRLEKANVTDMKDGYPLLAPKHVTEIKAVMRKEVAAKVKGEEAAPAFELDYLHCTATFRRQLYDLEPSDDAVKRDIEGMFTYIKGAENFTGNTEILKTTYWKILIY